MALESAIGAEPLSEWIWSSFPNARQRSTEIGWALRAGTARRGGNRGVAGESGEVGQHGSHRSVLDGRRDHWAGRSLPRSGAMPWSPSCPPISREPSLDCAASRELNLFRMRQFYEAYRDERVTPLARQIPWTPPIDPESVQTARGARVLPADGRTGGLELA